MEFRRSAEPNVRRRRVLKDESATSPDEASESSTPRRSRGSAANQPTRNYSEAALADNQPRITDVIPVRWWMHALLLLAAIGAIAVVQTLFLQLETWGQTLGRAHLTALDLNQRGSLAGWLSSLLLGGAFAAGALIFSIRRHKVNDYRGRYRVWLWAPAVLLLASMDAATDVRHVAVGLLTLASQHYTGSPSLAAGNSAVGWAVAGGLLLGAMYVRVGIEMRQSRAAMAFLVLSACGYLGAALVAGGVIPAGQAAVTIVAQSSAKLSADMTLLFSMLAYARYVYLDAQGELHKAVKTKKKKAKAGAAAEGESAKAPGANGAAEAESATAEKTPATAAKRNAAEPEAKSKSETAPAANAGDAKSGAAKQPGETKPGDAKQGDAKPGVRPAVLTRAAVAASQDDDDDGDDEDDEAGGTASSRAERKRLKRLEKNARRDVRKAA